MSRFSVHRLRGRVAGLVLDLFQCRLHIGVVRPALQDRFIFQNRRGQLPLLEIRLRDAFGSVDYVRFAAQLRVGFLENFQRLAIVRLRLDNDLEHLNCLLQLSCFTGI